MRLRSPALGQSLTRIAPFALVAILYLVTALLIPGYASPISLLSLLLLSSLLGIAAIGQTLTILLGGLDLSIPAVIGFADVAVSQLYGDGWPMIQILPLIALAAIAIGVVNALITKLLNVHPLIVTLATGSILLGGVLAVTHGQATGSVPDWLTDMVSVIGQTGPIPLPGAVVAWLLLSAAVIFLERRSVLGRWTFAIGANAEAARFARLPRLAVWCAIYAVSALLAAFDGVLLAGFSGAADASVGQPYLFTTVAAVVIGGTSLLGGRGGYLWTVAGCLIITELTTLLVGLGFDQPTQQVYLGVLIVLLVLLYGRDAHVRMRI